LTSADLTTMRALFQLAAEPLPQLVCGMADRLAGRLGPDDVAVDVDGRLGESGEGAPRIGQMSELETGEEDRLVDFLEQAAHPLDGVRYVVFRTLGVPDDGALRHAGSRGGHGSLSSVNTKHTDGVTGAHRPCGPKRRSGRASARTGSGGPELFDVGELLGEELGRLGDELAHLVLGHVHFRGDE